MGSKSGRNLATRLGITVEAVPAIAAFRSTEPWGTYTLLGGGEGLSTKMLRRKLKKALKGLSKSHSGLYLKAGPKQADKPARVEVEVDATGSGHAEVSADPAERSLWGNLRPGQAKGYKLAADFRTAGSAVWGRAREALLRLESATLLHANPDVFIVDNFISDEEADGLVEYYERRLDEQDRQPQWCFSDHYELPTKFAHLGPTKNQDSNDCITDQAAGREIATTHPCNPQKQNHCPPAKQGRPFNRTISRSVMTMTGESELADTVWRRVDGPAGLHRGHAYHTQLLDYLPDEDYREHTDCSGMENDRAVTVLVYLNTMAEGTGGGTRFPRLEGRDGDGGLLVQAVKGRALFWGGLLPDGRCDKRTTHEGMVVHPVPVGDASKDAEPQRTPQKFVLQRWYHATIMPTPSIGDDIFLCDLGDNCRHYMYSPALRAASALTEKGRRAKEKGNLAKAEKLFVKAVKKHKYHAYAAAWLGELQMKRQQDKGRALENYRNALVSCPYFGDTNFLAGQLLVELADYEMKRQQQSGGAAAAGGADGEAKQLLAEALGCFERLLEVNNNDADGWYYVGECQRRLRNKQAALFAYNEAIKRNPQDTDSRQWVARLGGGGS